MSGIIKIAYQHKIFRLLGCELCGKHTHEVDYDYLGNGTNHLGCELKHEEQQKEIDKVKHLNVGVWIPRW